MARRNAFQEIMDEHVQFPGFPQLITTRGFAYSYFKALGWDESERGFDSLDYMIFARKPVNEPLTETATTEHYLTDPRLIESFSRL